MMIRFFRSYQYLINTWDKKRTLSISFIQTKPECMKLNHTLEEMTFSEF